MPTITDNLNLFKPDPGQSGVAAELNGNWDQLDFRFDEAGGHTHDGTPGQGPKVPVTSIAATGTPSASTVLRGDGQWASGAGGSGVTDHADLTGLTDDDHTQYFNQSRGDTRYAQRSNNLSDLANTATARTNIGAAAATHQHNAADITSGTIATARLGSGTPDISKFLRADQQWAVPGAGGSVNLDDLADVLITSPVENQVLSYDAAGARWINEAAAGGGSTLDALTDTTITTPSDNQVLTYDGTTSQWRNESPPAALTNEDIDDRVNALIVAGTGITKTYDDVANTLTLAASGGGGSAVDAVTTLTLVDDFLSSNAATGQIGALNWTFSGGALSVLAAVQHHPGLIQRDTSASINTVCSLTIDTSAIVGHVHPDDTFDVVWIVRLLTNDANTIVRCGMQDSSGNPANNGVYIEKAAADTSWFGVNRAFSSEGRTAALAAVTTNYVKLRVRRVNSTTIGFSVDGGTELTLTANIPSSALSPVVMLINTAAAAKQLNVDFFRLVCTGLAR